MHERDMQRSRVFAGYSASRRVEDDCNPPVIKEDHLAALHDWREQQGLIFLYDDDGKESWPDSVPVGLRRHLIEYEERVRLWSWKRLAENRWATLHHLANQQKFAEAGKRLPPNLEQHHIIAHRPHWMPALLGPADVVHEAGALARDYVRNAYKVIEPADNERQIGPLVCWSNVSWWICPPAEEVCQIRTDGTYGEQDITMRPSWMVLGKLHIALQRCGPRGDFSMLQHSKLNSDMLYYKLDSEHIVATDPYDTQDPSTRLYRLRVGLAVALRRTQSRVSEDMKRWMRIHPSLAAELDLRLVQSAEISLESALKNELPARKLIEALGTWQYNWRQVAGWCFMNQQISELQDRIKATTSKNGSSRLAPRQENEVLHVLGTHVQRKGRLMLLDVLERRFGTMFESRTFGRPQHQQFLSKRLFGHLRQSIGPTAVPRLVFICNQSSTMNASFVEDVWTRPSSLSLKTRSRRGLASSSGTAGLSGQPLRSSGVRRRLSATRRTVL
jgi:hypothetical protein